MYVHHVAAVVRELEGPERLFRALGLPLERAEGPFGCAELEVHCAPVPLAFFRPAMKDDPLSKFLLEKGPRLHHLMLDVDDLASLVEDLKAKGVRFVKEELDTPVHSGAFIDPKQSHGGLIELGEWWGRPLRARPGEPVFDHVGWAVQDLGSAREFFSKLGLEVGDAVEDTARFACDHVPVRSTPCSISLKAPRKEGPFAKFLADRGPGLHHVCLRVADLDAAALSVRAAGFRLTPEEPIQEPHQATWFVHPGDLQGILIELGEPVSSPERRDKGLALSRSPR